MLDPRAGPVTGDPARLQQVVWNLLMNAVKFTPRGGRVELVLRGAGPHVEIVVGDTGQGIAPEMLPHVFERFRQADSSSTRAHGGLGLGLALVRHLVELHGGTVAAGSAGAGQGATFVVSLPARAADLGEGPVARPHPSAAEGPDLQDLVRLDGLRVLVVDDDGEAVRLAEAILTAAGAAVRTCQDAQTAMALVRGRAAGRAGVGRRDARGGRLLAGAPAARAHPRGGGRHARRSRSPPTAGPRTACGRWPPATRCTSPSRSTRAS